MTHTAIKPGMVLELKRDRMEAYGKAQPLVIVHELKYRKGYSIPFVVSVGHPEGFEFYKPSDFKPRS